MLDLETLGTEPGCAILSIGAVKFNADGISDEFERGISLKSNSEAGLTIDGDTLDWWTGQDNFESVLTGEEPLRTALYDFGRFYGDSDEIWAYSPSFDCAILQSAYEAVDVIKPWHYWDERCCRTLDNLIDHDIAQEGDEHNALDDARNQARIVIAALEELGNELR